MSGLRVYDPKKDSILATLGDGVDVDKPWFDDPSCRMYPLTSMVEKEAEALKKAILTYPDRVGKEATGTCYYVSNGGKADNAGNSPACPWDSLDTLAAHYDDLKEGDAVLFERGSLFRGCWTCHPGVSYGAYGSGEKPRVYGGHRNYAKDLWREVEPNIWTLDESYPADVGNIIFDHGEMTGRKRIHREELKDQYDFWSDPQDGNRVYLVFDRQPGGDLFGSIEIAFNLWMCRVDKGNGNNIIENICFRYCGGHGIRTSDAHDIIVRGCEFGYIGGCFLTGFRDGTTRYGNSIEFMGASRDILGEYNWAYQIYDSGYTNQGSGVAENIVFSKSLLDYCGMGSVEYWITQGSRCRNISYCENIMRYSGYGFGGLQRPDKNMSAHIQSNGACPNEVENFRIYDNIFELSLNDLVNGQSAMKTPPTLCCNTYIQVRGRQLGSLGEHVKCVFDENVANTVNEVWGDAKGVVLYSTAEAE